MKYIKTLLALENVKSVQKIALLAKVQLFVLNARMDIT